MRCINLLPRFCTSVQEDLTFGQKLNLLKIYGSITFQQKVRHSFYLTSLETANNSRQTLLCVYCMDLRSSKTDQ